MKRSMSVIDLTLGECGGNSCAGSSNGGTRKGKCPKLSIPTVIAPLTRKAYADANAPRLLPTSSPAIMWSAASGSTLSSNQDEKMVNINNSHSHSPTPYDMHSRPRPRQVTPVQAPRRVVSFNPFVSYQTIPSMQDIDLNEKRRLYYDDEEMTQMAINEKLRRQLYVLSKKIQYEQSRRLQHRLDLLNSHKITSVFHKVCTQHQHQQPQNQRQRTSPPQAVQKCGCSSSDRNDHHRSPIAAAA